MGRFVQPPFKILFRIWYQVKITVEMAKERPDLKPYVGKKLAVIAWLWARTVKSPNPAFAQVDVPLTSAFMLSSNTGKEAYVEAIVQGGHYRFTVKVGKPRDVEAAKNGTKLSRGANFRCVMSGTPISRRIRPFPRPRAIRTPLLSRAMICALNLFEVPSITSYGNDHRIFFGSILIRHTLERT